MSQKSLQSGMAPWLGLIKHSSYSGQFSFEFEVQDYNIYLFAILNILLLGVIVVLYVYYKREKARIAELDSS